MRLALTRTYKAPATQNMVPRNFISANNSRLDPDRRGNPRLKPEVALGLDASFEHYWGDGAMLSASASLRQIEDYTHNVLMQDGDRWLAMQVNDGRAETRGIELEAKLPMKALLDDAPALDLRVSASRTWSFWLGSLYRVWNSGLSTLERWLTDSKPAPSIVVW